MPGRKTTAAFRHNAPSETRRPGPLRKPPTRTRTKTARKSGKPLDGLLTFLSQLIKETKNTGMVWPSSPALAKAMTKSLRRAAGPKRLLEVGPGTGPFTKVILKALKSGDELHIVEISPLFARRLETTLLQPYREHHPHVQVVLHCNSIQSATLDGKFDYIVCSIPFNNLPPKVVREIFRRLMDLLKPGGELAYFEYAGVRFMKSPLVGPEGRRQLKQIGTMGRILRRKHHGRREFVLGNMPPAVAVRLTR